MTTETRRLALTVHRHHNVGTIWVPCFGCGGDIDQEDYVAVDALATAHHGVYLMHEDCAAQFHEQLAQAVEGKPSF